MIRLLVIFMTLMPLYCAYASNQEAKTDNKNKQNAPQVQQQRPAPQQTKPTIWPRPFQPSEEVGADSQISFPTDI